MKKIIFMTTLSEVSSTMIGRVLPLAKELQTDYEVHILDLSEKDYVKDKVQVHSVGREPFTRTVNGKKRLSGFHLILRMIMNGFSTARTLIRLNPEYIVIVKPLPQNALAILLTKIFIRPKQIILDVDDFELMANVLTSLAQRTAVHWSERICSGIADIITVATPFLSDHFEQLTGNKKPVHLVPTGLTLNYTVKELPQTPNLLYIGSVSLSSGHTVDMLPRILKKVKKSHPHAVLHMVGGGDDIETLKNHFKDLGLDNDVRWHGRFSVDSVQEFLNKASIIIDPINASVANRAKSSYRAALALAAGLPIITSNIGIRSVLIPRQFHARFFAEPGDAESYADKIMNNLANPLSQKEREELQTESKKYTWNSLAATFRTYL